MPLAIAPLNVELKIIRIANLEEEVKKHLESLGLTINARIKILSSSNGNVIILIKDFRLALDSNITRKIFVI